MHRKGVVVKMAFAYITRGNVNPQGKARVWFCADSEDQERFLQPLSKELLAEANCALWYLSSDEDFDLERHKAALSEMQLFLLPVTSRFLKGESLARTVELPFAIEHHIPVLPLMEEEGLLSLYAGVFGNIQYLSRFEDGDTGLSYREKYKRFVESVLVADELAEQVRASFDARLFLSYRKKDRAYADQFMRLLHAYEPFMGVGIWYDEFLVPGENFNEAIEEAMNACHAVALIVTPNLVCEKNYVSGVEYPMATEREKKVLPVEFVATDKEALLSTFSGLRTPAAANAKEVKKLFGRILKRKRRKTPEQNYLLGIAYLNGIEAERNGALALHFLHLASKKEYLPAFEKLYAMYKNGEGVSRDDALAAEWLSKKAAIYYKRGMKNNSVSELTEGADVYLRLGELYRSMGYERAESDALENAATLANRAKDLSNGEKERHLWAVCLSRRAELQAELGNRLYACELYELAADVFENEWKEAKTLSSLAGAASAYTAMAKELFAINETSRVRELFEKARKMLLPYKNDPSVRRAYAETLAEFGAFHIKEGENGEALRYLEENLSLRRERSEEIKTAASRLELAEAKRLLAEAYLGVGEEKKGMTLSLEASNETKLLAEKDPIASHLYAYEKALATWYEVHAARYDWRETPAIAEERLRVLTQIFDQTFELPRALSLANCRANADATASFIGIGRVKEAEDYAYRAVRYAEDFSYAAADTEAFSARLAAYIALGDFFRKMQKNEEAHQIYVEQYEACEDFLEKHPNSYALRCVYKVCEKMCLLTAQTKNKEDRLFYSGRMYVCAKKRREKEDNYTVRDGEWYGMYRVGWAQLWAGDPLKAEEFLSKALSLAEDNFARFPLLSAKCSISMTHCMLCDLYLKKGDNEKARFHAEASLALSHELEKERGNYSDKRNLYLAYYRMRNVANAEGNAEAELSACRTALEGVLSLCEEEPSIEDHGDLLFSAKKFLDKVGKDAAEDRLWGLAAWTKAAVFLAKEDPSEEHALEVVLAADRLGDAYGNKGDAASALEQYETALVYAEEMAQDTEETAFLRNAAILFGKVGSKHAAADNHFGAKNCFLKECEYYEKTFARSGKDSDGTALEKAEKSLEASEEKLFTLYGIPKSEKKK